VIFLTGCFGCWSIALDCFVLLCIVLFIAMDLPWIEVGIDFLSLSKICSLPVKGFSFSRGIINYFLLFPFPNTLS